MSRQGNALYSCIDGQSDSAVLVLASGELNIFGIF